VGITNVPQTAKGAVLKENIEGMGRVSEKAGRSVGANCRKGSHPTQTKYKARWGY